MLLKEAEALCGKRHDGEGMKWVLTELSLSPRVKELIKDLDIEIINDSDIHKSHYGKWSKRILKGEAEELVDYHAYLSCKLAREMKPKARIALISGDSIGLSSAYTWNPDVVSFSLTGVYANDSLVKNLSKRAFILWAAGNSGEEGEERINRYDNFVTTVGALDYDLLSEHYSSYGKGYVDIAQITNLELEPHVKYSGTSGATPFAAGLVLDYIEEFSKTLGYKPSNRTIRHWVENNSVDVMGKGWDLKTGYGMLKVPSIITLEEVRLIDSVKMVQTTKYRNGVLVKDEKEPTYVDPYTEDGRMRIAIRDLEKLGLTVFYDSKTKTVKITR